MIGLITSMVGGVFAAVLRLLFGAPDELTVWIGIGGGVLVFLAIVLFTTGTVTRHPYDFSAIFPATAKSEDPGYRPCATDRSVRHSGLLDVRWRAIRHCRGDRSAGR